MSAKKKLAGAQTNRIHMRNNYLDALKGLTICLVVLGHSIQAHSDFDNNFLYRLIYSFHMPLFMFVSGAVASYSRKPMGLDFIKKKFNILMIPFISWAAVGYFLTNAHNEYSVLHYAKRIIKTPDVGLWFLFVLFVIFCSLVLIMKLKKHFGNGAYFMFGFVFYAIPASRFGLGLVRWYLPFFMVGYFIFRHQNKLARFKMLATAVCVVGFPLLFYKWHRTTQPFFAIRLNEALTVRHLHNIVIGDILIIDVVQVFITIYKYAVAFTGIGLVYFAFKEVKNTFIRAFFARLGFYTLDIYALSNYFLFLGIGAYWLNIISGTVAAIIVSLLISIIVIRPIDILNRLFLGGRTAPKKNMM